MNKYKTHPRLIGISRDDKRELDSIEEVAKYICERGVLSDVTITDEDGTIFLNTFGIYIDRVYDMKYCSELLKILVPLREKLEGSEAIGPPDLFVNVGMRM